MYVSLLDSPVFWHSTLYDKKNYKLINKIIKNNLVINLKGKIQINDM